jgi:hypothetical protein
VSEIAPAHFTWDDDGRPGVVIIAHWPIVAICLSIHIDRNFSSRNWVQCIRCGSWLEQIRGRDRFCSKRCRNFYTTTERRKKIKLLAESAQAWKELSAAERRGQNRWQWIAVWAEQKSQGKIAIEPAWARQEIANAESQNRKTSKRKQGPQGGGDGTHKTR